MKAKRLRPGLRRYGKLLQHPPLVICHKRNFLKKPGRISEHTADAEGDGLRKLLHQLPAVKGVIVLKAHAWPAVPLLDMHGQLKLGLIRFHIFYLNGFAPHPVFFHHAELAGIHNLRHKSVVRRYLRKGIVFIRDRVQQRLPYLPDECKHRLVSRNIPHKRQRFHKHSHTVMQL